MSITGDKRPELKNDFRAAENPSGTPLFRRPLVIAAAVIVAAAVGAGVFWGFQHGGTSSPPAPPKAAPLTLPDTLSGLTAGPPATDFATQPTWRGRATAAAPGATVAGRSYGSAQVRRQIRVVAGRADLTSKLEFAWAADAGRTVTSSAGAAHCTQNLKLAAGSVAAVRPTMILCSRTTAALSAYAVIIDFDHHPTDIDGMTALNATWKAALTGR